jgi:hypothetical protein
MKGRTSVGADRRGSRAGRAVRLTPSIMDLGGLIQPGAPDLGYKRGAVDKDDVHKRMWKDIVDFPVASADERGVA